MHPKTLTVRYFALLKDKSGKSHEEIQVNADSPRELFAHLDKLYHFEMETEFIKVAVNDEFADWSSPLESGDEIVFLMPVAGG